MKKFIISLIFFFSFLFQSAMAADPETGWWWNPSESGRGFSIEQQGDLIFYAAYLYDDDVSSAWFTSLLRENVQGQFTGTMEELGNGQTLFGAYQPPVVVNANVGDITLEFDTSTTGTMTWPGGVVSIERFIFGPIGVPVTPSLNQASFQAGSTNYVFGLNSIPNIQLANAPADTDYSRWAMLHDGARYRLYFFKQSSNT